MDLSCICRLCEHCEHVWIAALCSEKLFPNLEAVLKGVFNRVLEKFTQSERVRVCSRKMLAMWNSRHPRSLMLVLMSKYRRRQGSPRSHPPSHCRTRTRDCSVTAGAQSHGTTAASAEVPAHRLRAYQHAHPVKLAKMARKRAQQHWRWAAHAKRDFASRYAHLYAR